MVSVFPDKRFSPPQDTTNYQEENQGPTHDPNNSRTRGLSPVIPISSPSRVLTPGSYGLSPMTTMSPVNSFYTTPSSLSGSNYSPSYHEMTSQQTVNVSLRNRVSV